MCSCFPRRLKAHDQQRSFDDTLHGEHHSRSMPIVERILGIARWPGLSIGVLHQEEVAFKQNFGVLNVETRQKPDSDSLYWIASLAEAFIAASLDLLVQEGKLSWDTSIDSVIAGIKHWKNPNLYSDIKLRDICSHRTGLLSPDEITQGQNGRITIPKKDLVQVCGALPLKFDLRADYVYNNDMYALAGSIIERGSDQSNWGSLVKDRIFHPLEVSTKPTRISLRRI